MQPVSSTPPLVAEYANRLRRIRCAARLTSGPTYVVTHKEEEGPRGRIAILRPNKLGEDIVVPKSQIPTGRGTAGLLADLPTLAGLTPG